MLRSAGGHSWPHKLTFDHLPNGVCLCKWLQLSLLLFHSFLFLVIIGVSAFWPNILNVLWIVLYCTKYVFLAELFPQTTIFFSVQKLWIFNIFLLRAKYGEIDFKVNTENNRTSYIHYFYAHSYYINRKIWNIFWKIETIDISSRNLSHKFHN